ncbi:phage tail terminator-like protein [Ramlibacter sp. AN1015]|uniref:phage tail terminator-like protein n=1 Tax=Ramlibacter sp. AN1015 TaxID=3133428 RepID=UPI0030C02EB0
MKYQSIQTLLDAHLAATPDLPALQLENTRNIATSGTPFARATLQTTEAVRESSMKTRHSGLYIVDLYYPQDTGVAAANAMADAVIARFDSAPLGRLSDDQVTVQLQRAWRQSIGRREPFYALQVVVRWHALI